MWVFVVVDEAKTVGSIVLRFTDVPAKACVGGEWKRVEVLRRSGVLSELISSAEASYELNGRALTIGLSNNICDAYNDLRGELSDTGFAGRFISEGMYYHEDHGSVYGARAAGQNDT